MSLPAPAEAAKITRSLARRRLSKRAESRDAGSAAQKDLTSMASGGDGDAGGGHRPAFTLEGAMPVLDILDLPAALPRYAPVAGLDIGEKTIGVAVSDVTRAIASPLSMIRKTKFTTDAEALFKLMDERGAAGLVIGLPVNMDGTEGVRCQSNRAFARNVLRLKDLPIAFWDERLSTMAINRMLIEEADMTRAKRAEVVDRAAAGYILQGALDRLQSARGRTPD
jgi:putative Holliday junction resolvase